MSNFYYKYMPNVYLAKCIEPHKKGEIIDVETKYGKINESIIFNLIFEKDGFYYYSIIREDGFNLQQRAKRKAERYAEWSASASKKSDSFFKASQEGRDFLSLGEPIKIGHHSEKRHRALIERNWNRMGNSVKMAEKAGNHDDKAEYWRSRENDINLSIPESVDFYRHKLELAKINHQNIKNGATDRSHGYSLTYAKKEVNKLQKLYEIALKLWG